MYKTIAASALVGALLTYRLAPKTKCEKKQLLGPKSGKTYQVEDFVDTGFVVVKADDGSIGVFSRRANGAPGYDWRQGKGSPATLAQIYRDMTGEELRPRAVPRPEEARSGAQKPQSGQGSKAHRGTP